MLPEVLFAPQGMGQRPFESSIAGASGSGVSVPLRQRRVSLHAAAAKAKRQAPTPQGGVPAKSSQHEVRTLHCQFSHELISSLGDSQLGDKFARVLLFGLKPEITAQVATFREARLGSLSSSRTKVSAVSGSHARDGQNRCCFRVF